MPGIIGSPAAFVSRTAGVFVSVLGFNGTRVICGFLFLPWFDARLIPRNLVGWNVARMLRAFLCHLFRLLSFLFYREGDLPIHKQEPKNGFCEDRPLD
jgi:hypothetical protein